METVVFVKYMSPPLLAVADPMQRNVKVCMLLNGLEQTLTACERFCIDSQGIFFSLSYKLMDFCCIMAQLIRTQHCT